MAILLPGSRAQPEVIEAGEDENHHSLTPYRLCDVRKWAIRFLEIVENRLRQAVQENGPC